MNFSRSVLVLLLAGKFLTPVAVANEPKKQVVLQGGAGFGGHSDANPESEFADRLGLNEDQKKKYLAMKAADQIKLEKLQKELDQLQNEIGDLMENNGAKDKLMEKFKKTQNISTQIAEINFASGLELRDMLTAEQKARLTGMLTGQPIMKLEKGQRRVKLGDKDFEPAHKH